MGQLLLFLVIGLTAGAIVFGVAALITGGDPGLAPAEPDGRAVPLPTSRPLVESDVDGIRFDTALRGYRMAQVDQALRRAAYDIGYKDELIGVLEAEVVALREGRTADADALRQVREAALASGGSRSTASEGPLDVGGTPAHHRELAAEPDSGGDSVQSPGRDASRDRAGDSVRSEST
ncbi:MAG TPA: DivIVA domain-containing protein [Micromonosporaceae bacterium]|nr:DivIVA domain-containing protein [Micromonosporaceae bacterium]